MAKSIARYWRVVVNGVNLSDHADNIDTPQEKPQIDVSGFGGSREFLPGQSDETLSVEFILDFGTNSVHQTLYPLYNSGSQFPVYVQPDSTAGTSSSNPIYGGTAILYTYNGGAVALNNVGKFTAQFKPAPNSAFTWGTVAP